MQDAIAKPLVRPATSGDMAEIAAIYAEAVTNGTGSFETIPPDEAEMARRIGGLLTEGFPVLVAEGVDGLAGYAYAGPYNRRAGYRYTVEDSVYVAPAAQGRGVGKALLTALIDRSMAMGFRQMVAVIGDEENAASIALHRALGFRHAGTLPALGRKHGRWLGIVFMQSALGDGETTPPPVEP